MRKSRLFLSLSIISMVAAVGVGVAQDRCGYTGPATCHVLSNHGHDARQAFETRDFEAMARSASGMIEQGELLHGQRYRAYALRGQGEFRDAIAAYHESMQLSPGRSAPQPVRIDAYIGLADCFARMGLKERAVEWIKQAESAALEQLHEDYDEASHYQYACVLAVYSTIEKHGAERRQRLAILHLEQAIKKGFNHWAHMRADIDLDALRGDPEFKALFPDA